MCVTAGDVVERIITLHAYPLRQHACHVVCHGRIGNPGLHECVADEHVEIKMGGDAQRGR